MENIATFWKYTCIFIHFIYFYFNTIYILSEVCSNSTEKCVSHEVEHKETIQDLAQEMMRTSSTIEQIFLFTIDKGNIPNGVIFFTL